VASTEFGRGLEGLGKDLQALMTVHLKAFTDLDPFWPEAGKFPTAEWLEMIVDDRRNAVVQHGHRLNLALDQLGSDLRKIAEKFEHADGENARKILEILEAGRVEGRSEVNAYSQATEGQQGNFSATDSWGDGRGDGYDNSVASGARTDGGGSNSGSNNTGNGGGSSGGGNSGGSSGGGSSSGGGGNSGGGNSGGSGNPNTGNGSSGGAGSGGGSPYDQF
jgi:hypothetical protein